MQKNPRAQPSASEKKLRNNLQKLCKEVDIIILTVNDNEKWAVLYFMEPPPGIKHNGKPLDKVIDVHEPNNICLGMFGGYKCAMVQTEMGADCRLEVEKAIEEFPQAQLVLLIGVALDCYPEKHMLGDVLVSKVIDGVGNIKYDADGWIICRPSRTRMHHVSQKFKNVFARGKDTWSDGEGFTCTKGGRQSQVHPGLLFSTTSLIDHQSTLNKIRSTTSSEAVGGEMEGVVVVDVQQNLAERSKSTSRNLDVVVIKGAADFADGNKDKTWQFTAALAATHYAKHKLVLTNQNLFITECKLYQCIYVYVRSA